MGHNKGCSVCLEIYFQIYSIKTHVLYTANSAQPGSVYGKEILDSLVVSRVVLEFVRPLNVLAWITT